jgi:hypothetical protein
MTQPQQQDNLSTSESISVQDAWELLFNEDSLRKGIEAEESVNFNICAGLDWGNGLGFLLLNPGLFGRKAI